jgi:hypothetical protein
MAFQFKERKMARQRVGSFVAKDVAGNSYTINMYRKVIDVTNMHSASRETVLGGLLELETSTGLHVNGIEKGSYEILDVRPIPVTSDDPQAP